MNALARKHSIPLSLRNASREALPWADDARPQHHDDSHHPAPCRVRRESLTANFDPRQASSTAV